jgi:hypothetical protein
VIALIVRADLYFYRVWFGHVDYHAALRCGAVVVEGVPALARQLPQWLLWSPMARFVREHDLRHATAAPAPLHRPLLDVTRSSPIDDPLRASRRAPRARRVSRPVARRLSS